MNVKKGNKTFNTDTGLQFLRNIYEWEKMRLLPKVFESSEKLQFVFEHLDKGWLFSHESL